VGQLRLPAKENLRERRRSARGIGNGLPWPVRAVMPRPQDAPYLQRTVSWVSSNAELDCPVHSN
jgi:hypothetical protein